MNLLVQSWAGHVGEVIARMTGECPAIEVTDSASLPAEALDWWQQAFKPCGSACAGTAKETWFALGAWVLKSAGIETTDEVDARNTWLEILTQAFSAAAAGIFKETGPEFTCGELGPLPEGPSEQDARRIVVRAGGQAWPVWVAFAPTLVDAGSSAAEGVQAAALERAPRRVPAGAAPQNIDVLMEVELPVTVTFGRARLPLKDVVKLNAGAIVELNRAIDEPVEVIVNNCLIARGEVVVVDGNFGVRIQEIVSREHRMRSLR